MKRVLKEAGITLIALIVTIIILLILAGVTISMATSGTGLFDKAKYAVDKYNNSTKDELDSLNNLLKLFDTDGTNIYDTLDIQDDNVKKWIASLNSTSITSLNQIVNNKDIMDILMNSKSALNYMLTNTTILNAVNNSDTAKKSLADSKYSNDVIIPKMNGLDPSKFTYSSDNGGYAIWKVFDRDTTTQGGTLSYIELPNWVQYDFGENYFIHKVKIVNAYQDGMTEQTGTIYVNDASVGTYDVVNPSDVDTVVCDTIGSKIKISLDKYNWSTQQSYLSEIYVYGFKIEQSNDKGVAILKSNSSDENVNNWIRALNTINAQSLDDVMNNEELLNILLRSQSARNYMATNETILNAVNNKCSLVSPQLSGYDASKFTYSSDNGGYAIWKVFDRDTSTTGGTLSNIELPNWVQYDYGEFYYINKIEIVNAYQNGMTEQTGTIYVNDASVGTYDVVNPSDVDTVVCDTIGSKIKISLDKYNWSTQQSYLSEIYIYGIKL